MMLKVRRLRKVFASQVIFDCAEASFPERGLIGIIGKSREGKSTLLHLLSALDEDYEGEILLRGRNYRSIYDKEAFRFETFGFVFQNYSLFNLMSVRDNLLLSGKRTPEELQAVGRILMEVGLNVSLTKRVNLLSGGERQRIAIARALIRRPSAIFCDEPTGALDLENKHRIMETLKKASASCLVVMVSHERELLRRYADAVYEIRDKKIVFGLWG